MKKISNFKKLTCLATCILILISLFLGFFPGVTIKAFAEEKDYVLKIATSNVLDDLKGATVDGKLFDTENYPKDSTKETTVLCFAEVGYSKYQDKQQDFSLYVYVYNPQLTNYKLNSALNKIQFSINDGEYVKYNVEFVNDSLEKIGSRLYIKFKVKLSDTQRNYILSQITTESRLYNVSGIELLPEGKYNADDYVVARQFLYSGYGLGYGGTAEQNDLGCVSDKIETIELDVNDTYWRSKTSNKGAHYQNQVNTVYFSVPNEYLNKYGKLQRIKAEWYEFKSKDIVVTSDQVAYDAIAPWIGKKNSYKDCSRGLYEEPLAKNGSAGGYTAAWSYCSKRCYTNAPMKNYVDTLYYLFKVNDIQNYDPYAEVTSIGGVSSNKLYDYILTYNKSYKNGTVKDGMISADLFESDIDSYRKVDNQYGKVQYGYSYYDFDANVDMFNLEAYKPGEHSFSENVEIYGFWETLFGKTPQKEESFENISPIVVLDDETMTQANWIVSDKLFVDFNEVDELKGFYNEAKNNDETAVLFRFARTDYYSAPLIVECNDLLNGTYPELAYRAWQSVFFDFDVIQLTFSANGVETIIPVVADPIDIVTPVTPPTHFLDITAWIWIALAIVLVCALGIFLVRLYKRG